jgi:hypothetical protein
MGRLGGFEPASGISRAQQGINTDLAERLDDVEAELLALVAGLGIPMVFGANTRTANVTGRYLNPSGGSSSPAGTGPAYDVIAVTGDIIGVAYYVGTLPATSMTLTPRIDGSEAAGGVTVLGGGATKAFVALGSPIAVTAGQTLVPRLDQVGAGGTDRISAAYVIRPQVAA